MLNNNRTILIEDIEKTENKEVNIHIEDYIDGIKTNKPVNVDLNIKSLGEFIKITGHISGTAILTCDLCLEEYEYELDINIDEMFAKNSYLTESKQEIEIKEDGFVTDLNGEKEIDIIDLIYQTIILDFPNKKVCDINCNGGDIFIRDDETESTPDPRMSIFKNIKLDK